MILAGFSATIAILVQRTGDGNASLPGSESLPGLPEKSRLSVKYLPIAAMMLDFGDLLDEC